MLGSILGAIAGPVISGLFNSSSSESASDANYSAQKEFAQNGLQWKAADARAAGLHPMAVLGSSGAAFSPSFTAGQMPNFDVSGLFDDMDSMKTAGQNLERPMRAQLSDHDRAMQAAVLRNQELQNSLLEGQNTQLWASIMGQPSNPPAPGPVAAVQTSPVGQANIVARPLGSLPGDVKRGVVQLVPSKTESSRPGDRGLAAGRSPLFRDQDVSEKTSWSLLNPEAGETFEAYGELAKPFLAGAAHLRRWWDNRPTKYVQKRSPKPFLAPTHRYYHRKPLGGK